MQKLCIRYQTIRNRFLQSEGPNTTHTNMYSFKAASLNKNYTYLNKAEQLLKIKKCEKRTRLLQNQQRAFFGKFTYRLKVGTNARKNR